MANMTDIFAEVDFKLLHKQKLTLLQTIEIVKEAKNPKSDIISEYLDGLICLIDNIEDEAEEMGYFKFPTLLDETDNNSFLEEEYNFILNRMSISKFLETAPIEQTYAVKVKNGDWYPLLDIECWEECPLEYDEPYRIEQYGIYSNGSPDWKLDKNIIAAHSLWDAIATQRGFVCGDIYFHAEYDRCGLSTHQIFLELLEGTEGFEDIKILQMDNEEFKQAFQKGFEDGLYIFRFV